MAGKGGLETNSWRKMLLVAIFSPWLVVIVSVLLAWLEPPGWRKRPKELESRVPASSAWQEGKKTTRESWWAGPQEHLLKFTLVWCGCLSSTSSSEARLSSKSALELQMPVSEESSPWPIVFIYLFGFVVHPSIKNRSRKGFTRPGGKRGNCQST